jgi:MoaA/NifB/PqqE/SkfB family radical SAM enzyme
MARSMHAGKLLARVNAVQAHVGMALEQAKTHVAERALKGVGYRLNSLLEKATDERIIHFMRRAETLAWLPRHKRQLRELRQLFESDHPALGTFHRILGLHPNYRRAVITNLLFNGVLFGERKRKAFERRHHITPPFLMVMSPLMRCNLHCLGCYAGNYPRGKDPLSLEVLDRAVTEAKQMGMYFFTISGGEPFMRKDLLDLYERHSDATFLIYTNGTLIDDEAIARMQACGNASPAISVEGFAEETNRRRGSYQGRPVYDIIMDTMDRLREAKIMFGFSATATRENAEAYLRDEFYDLMIEKGCLYGWFFIFVPVGQDASVDLMTTPEQRDALRRKTLEVRRTKPIFVADFWNDGCLTGGCMSGGTTYFHINYRGDLEPCVFMHFATENIVDLYQRGGHLWDVLETPFFKAIRERNRKDPNPLRPCPIIDHNEMLEEAVRLTGAHPTHTGAEDVIGRLKQEIRDLAADYGVLAQKAWESSEYDWAKGGRSPFKVE